jgi:DNA repair protein RadC
LNYNPRGSIKAWAEDDRPREKLLNKGCAALSDAELIAILIGSGNREMSAVELAQLILRESDNDLMSLAKLSLHDLMAYKGIGEAKAISVVAALELGRRRKVETKTVRTKINNSKVVYDEFYHLTDLNHEEFWVMLLKRNNEVIDKVRVSSGGVSGTVADSRLIFKAAIQRLASAIILVHNHPSGNLKPSQNDIDLTNKLKTSGKMLDIPVLDHVIVSDSGYYSFADEGML